MLVLSIFKWICSYLISFLSSPSNVNIGVSGDIMKNSGDNSTQINGNGNSVNFNFVNNINQIASDPHAEYLEFQKMRAEADERMQVDRTEGMNARGINPRLK